MADEIIIPPEDAKPGPKNHRGNPPGKGRPRGSKNKRTQALEEVTKKFEEKIKEEHPNFFDGDAHAFLVYLYKSPDIPFHIRMDAAKSALPYEKPRLATIQHNLGPDGKPIVPPAPPSMIMLFTDEKGEEVEIIDPSLDEPEVMAEDIIDLEVDQE